MYQFKVDYILNFTYIPTVITIKKLQRINQFNKLNLINVVRDKNAIAFHDICFHRPSSRGKCRLVD